MLRALISIDPENELIGKAVTWLSRQKRKGYRVSTKTSAVVVEAIAHYIEKSKEFDPNYKLAITLNGKSIMQSGTITRATRQSWVTSTGGTHV